MNEIRRHGPSQHGCPVQRPGGARLHLRERVVIGQLLVWLGVRSPCCHGRIIRPYGWPPTHASCATCRHRIRR